MQRSNRQSFIDTVRTALGGDMPSPEDRRLQLFPSVASPESRQAMETAQTRSRDQKLELLDVLIQEAAPLRLQVAPVPDLQAATDYIVELADDRVPEWSEDKSLVRWVHPLIDDLNLESALAHANIPVHATRIPVGEESGLSKRRLLELMADAFIGVTSADFCLAHTATVVMKTRLDQARAASLLPPIHVVVVELDQVIANLTELYALLKWDPKQREEGITHHMAFISGPSKTADIELVMVHGAHGPREMHLVVITG